MSEHFEVAARIRLIRGNIVEQHVDAIVNAANTSLLGGGGVDGAIHRAAGPRLLEECRKIGGCPTGEARVTMGYDLPSTRIIHTVGPIYRNGRHGERELLASAYRSSLTLAEENACGTVAFPSISTGAYGCPIEEAAEVALETVINWLSQHQLPAKVTFVLFSEADLSTYQEAMKKHL